jgi:hypothetical protein
LFFEVTIIFLLFTDSFLSQQLNKEEEEEEKENRLRLWIVLEDILTLSLCEIFYCFDALPLSEFSGRR